MPDSPTEEADWVRKIRHSNWGLSLIAIALVITNLGNVFEGADKIVHFVWKKPDAALEIYRADEVTRFSRELTRLFYSRLLATRRYLTYVQRDYPPDQQSKAWERYAAVFEDWNREIMVNILGLQQIYGTQKRNQFESILQHKFRIVHSCLENIHRHGMKPQCVSPEDYDINYDVDKIGVQKAIDFLDSDIYFFVTGLHKQEEEPNTLSKLLQ
jgi:hypothetical protein